MSATAAKLPYSFRHGTILFDSPDIQSIMATTSDVGLDLDQVKVNQFDSAVILYSSGTIGTVKGVVLTHRNLIPLIAVYHAAWPETDVENMPTSLITLPLFHIFSLFMCVRAVALVETVVLMKSFDFEEMLRAIEAYKVAFMPVSLVAMAKSEMVEKYDLSSLELVACGGAPLGIFVLNISVVHYAHNLVDQLLQSTGTVVEQ